MLKRAAFLCAFGSAVTVLFSITVSQVLLGLALAALLLSRAKLRLPPMWLPLALFLTATILSLLTSGSPHEGLPQLRKLFVFATLLVVFSTFRGLADVKRLALWWTAAGAVAAAWGLLQFLQKLWYAQRAGRSFYEFYVAERITGPMSHWMTFSGQLMIVLLVIAALLLFSPWPRGRRLWLWLGLASAGLSAAALVLGMTRGAWLGAAAGLLYLVWRSRPRLLLAVPILLVAGFLLAPSAVRTRLVSMVRPRGQLDSNQHRIVCWRTGWEMIRAHPWLGLGPEIVHRDFLKYVPAGIPRPLPEGWYGHLHSIYIHYAAERGVPALLFLLWMFAKILVDFWRAARERIFLHGAIAVVIAVMIEGAVELNLGDSEVLAMFLAVVACGYLTLEEPAA